MMCGCDQINQLKSKMMIKGNKSRSKQMCYVMLEYDPDQLENEIDE